MIHKRKKMENKKNKTVAESFMVQPCLIIKKKATYLCHTPTGRVWSKVSNRWLIEDEFCKGTGDHGQYLMTSLKCDLTGGSIPKYNHEIVLSSAYGTTKNFWLAQGLQIDHIDKNPRNNKIENLRLITDVGNKKNSRDRCWNKTRLSMDTANKI
ncbi:MAG: HNH endonuclease [Bacillota bacterium]